MSAERWNTLIATLPRPHFLQTYEWGQVKAQYGWIPLYAVWDSDGSLRVDGDPGRVVGVRSPVAAALLLKRPILRRGMAARLSVLYAPRGPLLDWANQPLRARVLADLQTLAKQQAAIFLKVDPDVILGTGLPEEGRETAVTGEASVVHELRLRGWRESADQIQFRNTVLINLGPPVEELLARMKQKTRYNIRLAEKKGVSLRTGSADDFGMLYRMYAETSVRDGFVIRDEGYYRTVWQSFARPAPPAGESLSPPFAEPIIAEVDQQPVAAIVVFYFAGRAYYVYGMSRQAHREKMPAYLLQWEAMKRARARGCTVYDLWGAPDVFDESDPMWGVYRFKDGFGGYVVRTPGAWDFAPHPLWYRLYSEVIPRLLEVMRSRGRARTKRTLGGA